VLQPDETLPHTYTGSVAEIIRTGRFHGRRDSYTPKLGDGAVWDRDNQDPTRGGKGHIGRLLVTPDTDGRFETIEANSGDAWTQREHRLFEPHFLGWIEYPATSPPGHIELRDPIVVADLGELALDDYVARVVTGELGGSRQIEALKAQAIAGRTFVQRALRDDPTLGTAAKPVRNGEDFQIGRGGGDCAAVARRRGDARRRRLLTAGASSSRTTLRARRGRPAPGREPTVRSTRPRGTSRTTPVASARRSSRRTKRIRSAPTTAAPSASMAPTRWRRAAGSGTRILRFFYGRRPRVHPPGASRSGCAAACADAERAAEGGRGAPEG